MPRESDLLKLELPPPQARAGGVLPAAPFFDADCVPADTIRSFHDDPDFVTGLARGLAVLLALSDRRRHMSIAQLARRTGIPRAATRRALHTLEMLGFAASDEVHRYYLRPRVLSFSHAYLSASPLAVLAQPILDRLGAALHEACSLAALDGDEIVYLARSASSRIMSPKLNVGRRLPAYCTSIGHVLLAHLPQAELDAYLARVRFYPYTDHTITSTDRLLEVLNVVRENGYGFASQQMEPRLCTLAVPVQDSAGHYVAGINVILQGRLLSASDMTMQFFRPLHEAALELGSLLLP
jgi:IclR family transcriptional regulator, pca regulon regulatory protein